MVGQSSTASSKNRLPLSADAILEDYRTAFRSRQASLMGRKEVLGGKAKFGIFGDGKEIPQLAMARAFKKGDIRAGYYRDQTFMFATGMSSVEEFFHQLYANVDLTLEPASGGRQMNGHFATRSLEAAQGRVQLQRGYFTHRWADAAPGGSGARIPDVPRGGWAQGHAVFQQRQ